MQRHQLQKGKVRRKMFLNGKKHGGEGFVSIQDRDMSWLAGRFLCFKGLQEWENLLIVIQSPQPDIQK